MSQSSFLPDDYLAQKADRRTNLICLTLFGVVMAAVVGAFLVTNRQRTDALSEQKTVNSSYQQAAEQISLLRELEDQRTKMLDKASLAASLVERVPRSRLLAGLTNRMPEDLSIIELTLKSEEIKQRVDPQRGGTGSLRGRRAQRGRTRAEAADDLKKAEAAKYLTVITIRGVAPSDVEVSRYMTELNGYELLVDVYLVETKEMEIEEALMREFEIAMTLNPNADVRNVDPLIRNEVRNPVIGGAHFLPEIDEVSVAVTAGGEGGE